MREVEIEIEIEIGIEIEIEVEIEIEIEIETETETATIPDWRQGPPCGPYIHTGTSMRPIHTYIHTYRDLHAAFLHLAINVSHLASRGQGNRSGWGVGHGRKSLQAKVSRIEK